MDFKGMGFFLNKWQLKQDQQAIQILVQYSFDYLFLLNKNISDLSPFINSSIFKLYSFIIQMQSPSSVWVSLQHNISSTKILQATYQLEQSILSIKENIEKRYGSVASMMRLVLKDEKGNFIANMEDESATFGSFDPKNGWIILVNDLNPFSIHKEIEDLASIEKYKISEEDYNNLPQNFRKWKKQLFQTHPHLAPKIANNPANFDNDYLKEIAETISVGDRCKLISNSSARGEVKFVGRIMDLGVGYYVGIHLDEPYGNSTGTVNGITYFVAPSDKYGIFVRPDQIEVGDFPVLDIDDQI